MAEEREVWAPSSAPNPPLNTDVPRRPWPLIGVALFSGLVGLVWGWAGTVSGLEMWEEYGDPLLLISSMCVCTPLLGTTLCIAFGWRWTRALATLGFGSLLGSLGLSYFVWDAPLDDGVFGSLLSLACLAYLWLAPGPRDYFAALTTPTPGPDRTF